MEKKKLGQWMLLAVVCLSFSVGEIYAQKHEFADFKRYAKENATLALYGQFHYGRMGEDGS